MYGFDHNAAGKHCQQTHSCQFWQKYKKNVRCLKISIRIIGGHNAISPPTHTFNGRTRYCLVAPNLAGFCGMCTNQGVWKVNWAILTTPTKSLSNVVQYVIPTLRRTKHTGFFHSKSFCSIFDQNFTKLLTEILSFYHEKIIKRAWMSIREFAEFPRRLLKLIGCS